jgi:hypothetical protein
VPDDTFDSIDAIEKHFGKLRKAAEKEDDSEEKVRAIALEEREAKADFREQAARKRELTAYRKAALANSGLPDDWQDDIAGSNEEEIDASVKKWKERYEKVTANSSSDDQSARRLYGDPVGNGGGNPPPPRTTQDQEWLGDFQRRFEGEGTGQVSIQEIEKYARILGGNHLARELARNSNIFRRNGITEEMVVAAQEGKLKQDRPSGTGVSRPPRG